MNPTYAFTALLALGFPLVSIGEPAELRALQMEFDNQLVTRVTDVYNVALGKLNENYSAGVERELANAKSAGDLESALALEAEKKRLAFKEPILATDNENANSLKNLRGIYRKELAKLNAQLASARTLLLTPHITQLKQLETDLTKADRLADAKDVMDYRQGLAKGVPAKDATVAIVPDAGVPGRPPANTPSPNTPPASTPAPSTSIPDPAPATIPSGPAIEVASELLAKGGAKDTAPEAIAFDGPAGDGRRGAKGVLLINDPLTGKNGSTWAFTYVRQGTARVVEIIHPHGQGQVIIHIQKESVGISTPKAWMESGYSTGDMKRIKQGRGFNDVFPLIDGEDYPLISKLDGEGGYELTMRGKVVATARVSKTWPMSLEIKKGLTFPGSGRDALEFTGTNLPMQWTAGYAAVIVGPIDGGANICREVRFWPTVGK